MTTAVAPVAASARATTSTRGASVASEHPVPTPINGEVLEVNPRLASEPTIVNDDPYGEGWIVRLKATLWSVQRAEMHTGVHAVDEYRAFLEAQGISCA